MRKLQYLVKISLLFSGAFNQIFNILVAIKTVMYKRGNKHTAIYLAGIVTCKNANAIRELCLSISCLRDRFILILKATL